MAQQVSSYRAKFASRGYIFYQADGSTGGVQYEAGTTVVLPANYAERMTGSRYPTLSPISGWINYTYLSETTPVYTTTTDKCKPPEKLEINVEKKVMNITGGDGGDLNTFTAFGLSWRERSLEESKYGEWSKETTTTSRTVGLEVNEGRVRQYRVRTQGSAGENYYSDWVNCDTLLNGVKADAPTVLMPVNGSETCSHRPVVMVDCGKKEEGKELRIQHKVDDGEWEDLLTSSANGFLSPGSWNRLPDRIPTLENGEHTVQYRVLDAAGTPSEVSKVTFAVNSPVWKRSIAAGDIISNGEISHQDDIREMLEKVNVQRRFYGLEDMKLSGVIGRFKDWKMQMNELLAGTEEYKPNIGYPVIRVVFTNDWPEAYAINLIRERIEIV